MKILRYVGTLVMPASVIFCAAVLSVAALQGNPFAVPTIVVLLAASIQMKHR